MPPGAYVGVSIGGGGEPADSETQDEVRHMATGLFPPDPGERRVVVVLTQHDIEKCSYERGAEKTLYDDEVHVLEFPARPQGDLAPALQRILDSNLARPGWVLVQSPFDSDTYVEASAAPQRFALAKHMYFSELCMHLGASVVSVEQVDVRTRTGKTSLELKGERAGNRAKLTVLDEELEKLRAEMHLRDVFAGGPPDTEAAEKLLRSRGLWADPNMRALLEMRRGGPNQLRSRKLVLNLSSEARNNLSVAGRLKLPAFLNLSADFSRVISEQHEYGLTVSVEF